MGKKLKVAWDKKTILMNLVAVLLIVLVSSHFIEQTYGLKVVGDEFGYWSSAAWLSGYDWTEIASYNEYYGYGYGLLLFFILKLGLGHRMTYQLALYGNVLFLIGIYVLSYKLIKRIDGKLDVCIRVGISMCAVLYTGVLYYSQFTLSETLISLLYWFILYNSYCLFEAYSGGRSCLQLLLLVFCFFVHQRLLGLMIVGFAFLIYAVIKHKRPKQLLWIVPLAIAFFFMFLLIKSGYKSCFLSSGDMTLDANEFSGQVSKLTQLFSLDGIGKLVIGFLGKLYYACSGTFFLFMLFVVSLVRELSECKREKKMTRRMELFAFTGLVTLACILISVVYLLDYTNRHDLLTYGRYFDFSLSPLIVFALIGCAREEYKELRFVWLYIVYLVLSLVVCVCVPRGASKKLLFIMCPAIDFVLREANFDFRALTIYTLAIVFLLRFIVTRKKQTMANTVIPMLLLLCIWSGSFLIQYRDNCLVGTKSSSLSDERLAEEILELGAENDLHYYMPEDMVIVDCLQFIMKEYPIHAFTDAQQLYTFGDEDYVLTISDTMLFSEVEDVRYERVAESALLSLWRRVE